MFFFLCVKYLAIEDNKKHPYGFGDFMGTDRQTGFAIYSNDTGCYYFSFSFFISSIKEIGIMSCQFFSGAGNENLVRSTMVSPDYMRLTHHNCESNNISRYSFKEMK